MENGPHTQRLMPSASVELGAWQTCKPWAWQTLQTLKAVPPLYCLCFDSGPESVDNLYQLPGGGLK